MARLRFLITAVGVALLLVSCSDPAPVPSVPSPAKVQAPAKVRAPENVRVAPEWKSRIPDVLPAQVALTLRHAGEALERGQLQQGSSPGPGALEFYLGILAVDPGHVEAQAGVQRTLDALLERGRLAMRGGRIADAERIELIVRSLQAEHRDLRSFRKLLDGARTADKWVARADAAGQRGNIIDPANASARHFLGLAVRAFPDYAPERAARSRWNQVLLKGAWQDAVKEDFESASKTLGQSARLAPRSAAARVMALRIIELRQARTRAVLAAGNRAVDQLQLDNADAELAHAQRIAAQPSGPEALRERIHLARHYGPFKPGQVFTDKLGKAGSAPEMVVLPYGRFTMGADDGDEQQSQDHSPAHAVTFARGFAIARNETTVADFRRFVVATGYRSVATKRGHSTVYDEKGGVFTDHEGVDWRRDHVGRIASPALPVVHVTLDDANAYARWLSARTGARYRLPSEAEFEYALRAGTKTSFPWGDGAPRSIVGNLAGDGDLSRTGRRWGNAIPAYRDAFWGAAPVRNFAVEPFSTFDLVGNVAEWTLDCWHEGYQRAPVDGSAWVNPGCPQRVVRGASWGSSLDQARSAARLPVDAGTSTARIGFRLVREI